MRVGGGGASLSMSSYQNRIWNKKGKRMDYLPHITKINCECIKISEWEELCLITFENCFDHYDLMGGIFDALPFSSN